ncbi:lysozyme [Rhizobium sp. L43]|uniref:lysozyme n=1 Tax=Rhizobium sp. L43 TaxID=2035452 RepID=UPI000BE81933|nr:lysozyme [Rhizobium sp. L43]PDS75456.1 muraminidase [Rhizobium sp. L43]
MAINSASEQLIKSFEACKLTCYADAIGVPTIGWGTTKGLKKSDIGKKTITQSEADRLFSRDVAQFEKAVLGLVKVPLTPNQFGALVSFTYNCGSANLAASTLLKKVNAKDFAGAANEFARWNKAGGQVLAGLTRRRAAEATLFATP